MRTIGAAAIAVALLAVTACGGGQQAATPPGSELFLPVGDADAGRQAFIDLRCYSCHSVQGDADMPSTTSANRGPEIGERQADDTREDIARSIISPSHELPPLAEGPLSNMGDYREAMTVQQLIDLVAFVSEAGAGGM